MESCAAANLYNQIVTVVYDCHTMRVMHRDLKLENFMSLSKDDNSPLKATNLGLFVVKYVKKRNMEEGDDHKAGFTALMSILRDTVKNWE
ncbi:hypothetical protein JHK84_039868 [Glycine max]|nr:hypothetical protein JHK86_039646 [Glycine max]KAG4965246.1 hypothetical protein JHK85_040221 [Glycine max]KAG5121528.1 hypothetical protein JHK84_039868 [Glycine max]